MSGLIFVGGIITGNLWLDDGKKNSRNFRQGNRVYDSEGIATALSANSVGGLGGETSLYLVNTNKRKEDENLECLAIKGDLLTRRNPQRQKGISEEVMFTLRQAVTHGVIEVQTDTKENKRKEDENLTNKQTTIFEYLDNEKTTEQKPFKYISLFAGIGGFDFGLNAVGGECVFASEIDKFAKQAYTTLHGLEPHGDITKIDAKDIPDHDVIAAGFPCQSFSVAGKRGGFEDARGTLFFEVARIASERQPKVLLLENVKGLVGHDKGKTLDTIVKTLNEIGYRVDFEVLNSKYFGVPQNRERIFIVAIREDLVANEPWKIEGNTVVPKGKRRISGYEDVKTFNFDWPTNDTVEKRLVDVLESDVDEKFYLSEEKTSKLVAKLEDADSYETRIIDPSNSGRESALREYAEVSPTLTSRDYKDPRLVGHREPKIIETTGINLSKQATEVKNITDVSGTLMARDYKGFGNQEMTGVVEGLPIREATKKGYAVAYEGDAVNISFPSSNTRRGRVGKDGQAQTLEASGVNQGVVLPAIGASRGRNIENPSDRTPGNDVEQRLEINSGGTSNTLTSVQKDNYVVEPPLRIRKLTPLECWRLQGFTDEQHNAVEASGISNSQRYKQAGNAVTINVIEAIGTRLLPYL